MHRIPYGARLRVDEGDKVKRGQRIAEWDPYTRPILTEVDGIVAFEDLVEGQSMSETLDESTGIAKRVVIDWRTLASARPTCVRRSSSRARTARSSSSRAAARRAISSRSTRSSRSIRARKVKAGDVIARIPTESAKTRDITGGLPRVAELFEARRPKEAAIIAEIAGTVRFGRDYKNKRRITIEPTGKGDEPRRVSDPEGQAHPSAGRRRHREGRLHRRGQSGAARHSGDQGRRGTRRLSGQRNPGGLPAAGREHQRQAHRGDRSPDAAEGRDRRRRRDRADRRASRSTSIEIDEINVAHGRARARSRRAAIPVLLGITKAVAADPLVHLGGVVPGDHARAHRGRGQRQGGHARRPQGERHRRPPDPGRHRRDDEPLREVAVKRDALILEEREKDAAKAAAAAEAAAAPAPAGGRIGRFADHEIERAARRAALLLLRPIAESAHRAGGRG